MNCKKCGNVLKQGDKVCSNCGESVDLAEDLANIKEEKNVKNEKSNNALIIILIVIVLLIISFMVYASILKYNNNDNGVNTPNNPEDSLDNNPENNYDENGQEVNYVLNYELANVYEPITDTKIKIEDSVLSSAIIMEIDDNKNVGYYFDDCSQNCEPTIININDEQAKYIAFVNQGYTSRFIYAILTEEGNIYTGNIDNTMVEAANKVETDNTFVNITYGSINRTEENGKAESILGITGSNDYYNVLYCPNIKSGDYLTYSYYSDISDVNNPNHEYVLIYNAGFLSYLSISMPFDAQRCENYNYNQYIVNSNNERIQAQVVLYNDGFYILGIDDYLYKLTSTKNGDNYVADLYSFKKVQGYSYQQDSADIRSITFKYDDGTEETLEDTYGNVQIVMFEENK